MTPAAESSPADAPARSVAEIQGLYGPFSFPEKLFQKIWRRGDFNRAGAVLGDGRPLRVLHAGKWNLLGGPDFKDARLRLGNEEARGDVELHLRMEDWAAHGHAEDPAYARVVLHVVLFPPRPGLAARAADGRVIPTLVLLPLLPHDLEEYAAEEAVEHLANRPAALVCEELARLGPVELGELLQRHADQRWRQKVHFARLRWQRLGWESACHHVALEILGYRFNRAPMLRVAARFPLEQWTDGALDPEAVRAGEEGAWSLQGVRPANLPRVRLRQYAAWTRDRRNWPADWAALAEELPGGSAEGSEGTADYRRRHGLGAMRERLAGAICAGAVSGARFDTLCCDGLLPLAAARSGHELGGLWFHWFPGDLPPCLPRALRELGVTGRREAPVCHGVGQGLLGWLIEREGHAQRPEATAFGRGA